MSGKYLAGNQLSFSGKLTFTTGQPVPGATILIKDNVRIGSDKTIMTLRTNDWGQFYGTWTAQARSSGSWDFYAEFKDWSNIKGSKSEQYSVNVDSNITTRLVLDRIPASAKIGEVVTFTGRLTSGGQPLREATIHIMDDDTARPDDWLASGRTDYNGQFSIVWTANDGKVENELEIYAKFDEYLPYSSARSPNQKITIQDAGGSITLNQLPGSVRQGELVTFSGRLTLESRSSEGAIVYIKDEDTIGKDDLLVTAYVDGSGRFSADWRASPVDPTRYLEIYAVFEGTDYLPRLTTCDDGPTRKILGQPITQCNDTVKLRISPPAPTPPPPPTPPSPPALTGDEYMKLVRTLDFDRSPRVAISPNPDEYDKVKRHIVPVKEGVLMWTSMLQEKYGGNWNVEFEVLDSDSNSFWNSKPDIVINLVTPSSHDGCDDYFGVASYSEKRPIQTQVCSTWKDTVRSNIDVRATAAHEFIHAMGVGHAFNKDLDMMCSVEDEGPTCNHINNKSKTPSDLNLRAVAKLYGADGYLSPNYDVESNTRLYADGSKNPSAKTITSASGCTETYSNYNFNVDVSLKPDAYLWWTLCPKNTDTFSYHFSTDDRYNGFMVYWLTPDTNVRDFVKHDRGRYYTCEEYGQPWISKSGTCTVPPGSKLVLYGGGSREISIGGYVSAYGFR